MTVHETWGSGHQSRGERVRAVAGWFERVLVGPLPPVDDSGDPVWDVEPFPGPPAGSGHVRLLPVDRAGDRLPGPRGSSDRPVVEAEARH